MHVVDARAPVRRTQPLSRSVQLRSRHLQHPSPGCLELRGVTVSTMISVGILLNLVFIRGLLSSVVPLFPGTLDCEEAVQECISEPKCERLYRQLDYCVDEEAVAPLGPDTRQACSDAQNALLHYHNLQECKCQRGSRRELVCLRVYWTVRFPQGYDDIETSPYEDIELELVRNAENSKLASIVAVSSFSLDGQNRCLKAAQDCGLFEKCGALRSEYVLACTKRAVGSERCNRQKCHRALRRFLERVPEEYSFSLLFCSCTDPLCGERRRKTIVPSCSYEERETQPNCLHLEIYCLRDDLCRSRLADFQQNCQPSPHSPSGCLRESGAVCLKAYAGLIGTIMTPNYVSNSSTEVSQWCNCEGSGNQWQDCLRILHMFNSNACLRNAIDNMGSSNPRPVEGTPLPPPRPSPHLQHDELHVNLLSDLNSVEESEEEKQEEEEEEEEQEEMEAAEEFNVIPPFSDKATVTNLGGSETGRVHSRASSTLAPAPMLMLMLMLQLLLLTTLSRG
ncbi:GDNF family receptor alpha-3 [Astyanax mexicanus]|uniref:GDNF family receptor alpha-3 n=1 Tax=Astyanax mexicanus TaxID=7994 RepID=UPI0020CAD591|nr:GDNF family receptor alpha-3 [Astyanax mexicanus]